MRYCSPSIAADRIVALMQGLRLNPASSQNVQMLGYAAGPGAFAPAPFTQREVQPVAVEVAVAAPVRQVRRPAVAKNPSVDTATVETAGKAEKTIVNAVKVPMPGEAAAIAAADTCAGGRAAGDLEGRDDSHPSCRYRQPLHPWRNRHSQMKMLCSSVTSS
jgi:hypothetical protein